MSKLWTEDEVKCGNSVRGHMRRNQLAQQQAVPVKRADGKVIKSASYSPVRFDGIIQ